MNCREAQAHLFSENAGARDDVSRASVAEHVAGCAACRRISDNLTATLSLWRAEAASATVPDAEREWYAVRRRIRGADTGTATSGERRSWLGWLAGPLTAAAAVAIALNISAPNSTESPALPSGPPQIARADLVEVPDKSSTIIYVDDKSRWLFVVASDPVPKQG